MIKQLTKLPSAWCLQNQKIAEKREDIPIIDKESMWGPFDAYLKTNLPPKHTIVFGYISDIFHLLYQ